MNAIWQLWNKAITDEQVNNIIRICETYELKDATVGVDGTNINEDIRVSEVRWVGDQDVKNTMWFYAHQANKNAFGFDMNYLQDMQYTVYRGEKTGKYDWHQDTFWSNPTMFDRKITVVMQLSDPSDYEGGLLELDPEYENPEPEILMERGTVIAFPSFIRHRVTPVTSGIRKSLVAWFEGPKFR